MRPEPPVKPQKRGIENSFENANSGPPVAASRKPAVIRVAMETIEKEGQPSVRLWEQASACDFHVRR